MACRNGETATFQCRGYRGFEPGPVAAAGQIPGNAWIHAAKIRPTPRHSYAGTAGKAGGFPGETPRHVAARRRRWKAAGVMKAKTLLIDDDRKLARLLSEYRGRFEIKLSAAGNGEEG